MMNINIMIFCKSAFHNIYCEKHYTIKFDLTILNVQTTLLIVSPSNQNDILCKHARVLTQMTNRSPMSEVSSLWAPQSQSAEIRWCTSYEPPSLTALKEGIRTI